MFFDTSARRSVWDVFGEMQRVVDSLAQPATRAAFSMVGRDYPPANVWTKDNAVAVSIELPGVESDSIELSVESEVLTISGKRSSDLPEDAKILRRERGDLEFSRSIQLPFPVEADQAEARFNKGVLLVVLERKASDRPQKIKVTATE